MTALLIEAELAGMDKASELMSGGDKAELVLKEIAAAKKKSDEAARALLGDEHFKQLKDYENIATARKDIAALKVGLENNPLTADQSKHLLDVVVQERASIPSEYETGDITLNNFKNLNAEGAKQMLQAHEQMHQRIRSRSAAFLTPEQTEVLADLHTEDLAEVKTGLTMLQALFGKKE